MLTNDLFRDLYHDRWGDPANPNAVEPPPAEARGGCEPGILGRLANHFRRRRGRPSAWSFTISAETSEMDDKHEVRDYRQSEDPKFLTLAKALSRNC